MTAVPHYQNPQVGPVGWNRVASMSCVACSSPDAVENVTQPLTNKPEQARCPGGFTQRAGTPSRATREGIYGAVRHGKLD